MYTKILIYAGITLSIVFYAFALNQESNLGPGDRDSDMGVVCQQAFEGKCFHGSSVDLSYINTPEKVGGFCVSNPNWCSDEECYSRVSVITGFASSGRGNPCLSDDFEFGAN